MSVYQCVPQDDEQSYTIREVPNDKKEYESQSWLRSV